MNFISLKFLVVFSGIFACYWMLPQKVRNAYLLVVSYTLYMMWKPTFAITLLLVTMVTYFGARLVAQIEDARQRKLMITVFVLFSLAPLVLFKYSGFIDKNISSLLARLGWSVGMPTLEWAVPIGISFFTFQAIGYLLDVYHRRCEVETNVVTYGLFVSFFPQITSGPISTAGELMPQLKSFREFSYTQAVQGLRCVLLGVFLKTVIADRAGIYVDTVFDNFMKFSGVNCFIASVTYSIQIYTDFFGYSLIAIGISKLLGINLINNFNRPYLADSVTEFWRRWHISLTRWLKNHVYIPLGGSRCSKMRNYLNIMVTFLVSGIWHGANWTFIVWGILHGMCQVIEKSIGLHKFSANKIVRFVRIIFTFLIVNFAWSIFRSPDMSAAYQFLRQIFTGYKGLSVDLTGISILANMAIGLVMLMVYEVLNEYYPGVVGKIVQWQYVRFVIYLVLSVLILTVGVIDGSNFIYISF